MRYIPEKHQCRIFNCPVRHGNYCCAYCDKRDKCDDPCLNHPSRCKCFDTEPASASTSVGIKQV